MLREVGATEIGRINLSTTLSTNAIVEGTTEKVGMIVSAGPGIEPGQYKIGDHDHRVEGALDHRGTEILPLDARQLEKAIGACKKAGITSYAAVSKFSPRNPAHENAVRDALASLRILSPWAIHCRVTLTFHDAWRPHDRRCGASTTGSPTWWKSHLSNTE